MGRYELIVHFNLNAAHAYVHRLYLFFILFRLQMTAAA